MENALCILSFWNSSSKSDDLKKGGPDGPFFGTAPCSPVFGGVKYQLLGLLFKRELCFRKKRRETSPAGIFLSRHWDTTPNICVLGWF